MKTKNLTPWCNLFSVESKLEITVLPSRYRFITYGVVGFVLACSLYLPFQQNLSSFSIIASFYFLFLSVLFHYLDHSGLFNQSNNHQYFTVELSGQGDFIKRGEYWQLLPSSRTSFVGCWLVFSKQANANITQPAVNLKKACRFIYKDSLSAQDFSRLDKVIRGLKAVKDTDYS